MRRILIIMGRYLPGYKDGGPVRSIKNLVDCLGEEYAFSILTCDRDHGDCEPYSSIKVNEWNEIGNARVYYVPPRKFSFKLITKLSNSVDLVYICGCFNDYAIKTMILNRFGIIKKPVVIASMGLFSPKAFRLKYIKKKMFTILFNFAGMFKGVYWSATSLIEVEDIKRHIDAMDDQFIIAEDLPRIVINDTFKKNKIKDCLDIVWISRITEKKNLIYALRIIKKLPQRYQIKLSIYGPIHSKKYWVKCESLINTFDSNVQCTYMGELDSELVVDELKSHHVFLFPTLGENYGHVIQEALSAGCPCIVSDQTPWTDLEEFNCGYALSLDNLDEFVKKLIIYLEMDADQFDQVAQECNLYAMKVSNEKLVNTGYRRIFSINCKYTQ